MRRQSRPGFTIIELLVVIAIIGMLIALLMPAVQYAREAGRATQCSNNLKQLGVACQAHLDQRGHYPTGGWGWRWAGDPDRGYGKKQPGGWLYNLLPFIEQEGLYRTASSTRVSHPIPTFGCPSRRAADSYPYIHPDLYFNMDEADRPETIGRSDYAACGGDMNLLGKWCWTGPESLAAGDAMSESAWAASEESSVPTGVIYRRSTTRPADIRDGATTTYLAAEKYLSPVYYASGEAGSDDQGWDTGYDFDVIRWTAGQPRRDTVGYADNGGCDTIFGSAHNGKFHAVFCDGSVRALNYSIDLEIHRRMGTRDGGKPVDQSVF